MRTITKLIFALFLLTSSVYSQVSNVWAVDDGEYISWKKRNSLARNNDSNKVWQGNSIKLFGGRNEVVAFQLVLENGATRTDSVNVRLDSLSGTSFTLKNTSDACTTYTGRYIELFREHFLWLPLASRSSESPWNGGASGSSGWTNSFPKPDSLYSDIWVPEQLIPLEAPRAFFSHSNGTDTLQGGAGGKTGPGFRLYPNTNEVIWFDIFIPKTMPSGVYTGNVIVWKTNGATLYTIPIELRVYSFTLSDTTHIPNMWAYGRQSIYDVVGETGTSNAFWNTWMKRWYFMLHRHRMSPVTVMPKDTLKNRMMGFYSGWKYNTQFGYEGPSMGKGTQIYSVNQYGTSNTYWPRKWGDGDANVAGAGIYYSLGNAGNYGDTPTGWRAMADDHEQLFLDSASSVLRFVYMIDEPYRRNYDPNNRDGYSYQLQMEGEDERAGWVRTGTGVGKNIHIFGDPSWFDVTSMNAIPASGYRSTYSIWMAGVAPGNTFWYMHTNRYQNNYPPYYGAEQIANQVIINNSPKGLVGVYNSYAGGFTPTEKLDCPLSWSRIPGWILWEYRDCVNLYYMWDLTFWQEASWNEWEKLGYTNDPGLGYGSFMYLGQDVNHSGKYDLNIDMPIAGMRMKAYRRGFQDYEYLTIANQQGKLDTNWVNNASVTQAFDDFRVVASYRSIPDSALPYHKRGYRIEAIRQLIADAIGTVSSAKTYHVKTTGNDNSGDGTSGNPYLTISKATSMAASHDSIRIYQGVYTGTNNIIQGKSDITYYVASPDTVQLSSMAYGILMTGTHGVKVDGGSHYGLRLRDITSRAFKISNQAYHDTIKGVIISVSSKSIGHNDYCAVTNDSTGNYATDPAGNVHGIWLERIRFRGEFNAPDSLGATPGGTFGPDPSAQGTRDMLVAGDVDTLILKDCYGTGVNHYLFAINYKIDHFYAKRDTAYYNHGGWGAGGLTSNYVIEDCWTMGGAYNTERHGSLGQWATSDMIMRFNKFMQDTVSRGLILNAGANISIIDQYDDKLPRKQYWYNNTITYARQTPVSGNAYPNPDTLTAVFGMAEDGGAGFNRMNSNVVKNNIMYSGSKQNLIMHRNETESGWDADSNYYAGNAFYNYRTSPVYRGYAGDGGFGADTSHVESIFSGTANDKMWNVTTLHTLYPRVWGLRNKWIYPNFLDTLNHIWALHSSSKLIDSAVALTQANGGGTNITSLTVFDSRYFTDGWNGWFPADSIKIGTSAAVGIVSVNRSTHAIVLNAPRSWATNNNVYLWRNGQIVNDVGAEQFAGTPSTGKRYYIDVGGNNNNDGLSYATRWLDISKANSTLQAGDTVFIYDGKTYSSDPIDPANSGTAEAWITYCSPLGEHPVITGCSPAIKIYGRDYISVTGQDTVKGSGFRLTNNGTGFEVYGYDNGSAFPNYFALRNLYIDIPGATSFYHSMVISYQPSKTPETYYNVQNTGPGELAYIQGANTDTTGQSDNGPPEDFIIVRQTTNVWVHDCVFPPAYHTSGVAPMNNQWYVEQRTSVWGPTHGYLGSAANNDNALFEYNFMRDGGQWPAPVSGGSTTQNSNMSMNIFRFNRLVNDTVDNNGGGYGFNIMGLYEPTQGVRKNGFYNNVFWGRTTKSNSIRSTFVVAKDFAGYPYFDNRIYNNVMTFGGETQATIMLANSGADSDSPPWATFDGNNVWRPWQTSHEVYITGPGYMSLSSAMTNYSSRFKAGNFTGNPLFLDTTKAGGYPFAINASSPLFGTAVPLSKVTANGTNVTTVYVDAPWMFWPGSYYTSGDSIKIGGTSPVKVTGRDTTAGTITIGAARTVVNNDNIYLWKNGVVVNDVGVYQLESGGQTPTVTASTTSLADFGNIEVGTNSASASYTVSGTNLISTLDVYAPTNFKVSLDNTVFADQVSISPTSGTVSTTTIYARFYPLSTGIKSGSITNTSANADDKYTSVSGTGTTSATINVESTVSAEHADNVASSLSMDINVQGAHNAVFVYFELWTPNGGDNATSVTVGGSNATLITRHVGTGWNIDELWYIKNVPTGTRTIVINKPLADECVAAAACLSNVDQVTTIGTPAASIGADTPPPSLTLNSAAGEMSLVGLMTYNVSVSPGSGESIIIDNNNGDVIASVTLIRKNGEPQVQIAPTITGYLGYWVMCGVSVKPYVGTNPTINVSTTSLTDFGSVEVGTASTAQSYTVSGTDLSANVVITAPSQFKISTDNVNYYSSLSLTPSNGTLITTTIFTKFYPTSAGAASGNITHTSTDATTKNVSVSGTGVTLSYRSVILVR